MPSLRATIENLAAVFANQVADVVSRASVADLASLAADGHASLVPTLGPLTPKSTVPRRRSPALIRQTARQIVGELRSVRRGMGSEELQKKMGLTKAQLLSPLKYALKKTWITKRGERRGTTYHNRPN